MERDTEYFTIYDVVCTHDTEHAILIEVDDEEYWIPKSQISDDSEVYEDGGEGTCIIPLWLAEKKGLA